MKKGEEAEYEQPHLTSPLRGRTGHTGRNGHPQNVRLKTVLLLVIEEVATRCHKGGEMTEAGHGAFDITIFIAPRSNVVHESHTEFIHDFSRDERHGELIELNRLFRGPVRQMIHES